MLGFIREGCRCGQQLLVALGASHDVPGGVGLAVRAASALGAQLVMPAGDHAIVCPRCGAASDLRRDPVVRLFEVLASVEASLSPHRAPLN